ncbi:MAG: 50S ribosomal protein L11, partial [Candidatus Micrarchaeota archaeon]|nr:50S ribosomal protein L11 [Candidatus Micrarchaeota archaeon]
KASGGPKLSNSIVPLGINVNNVVKEINEKTKDFAGVTVPVKVIVNKENKTYKIEVGVPAVASLIKKEIGIEKGAKAEPGQKPAPVGDIPFEKVVKIAKIKIGSTNTTQLKSAVLSVLGTCLSVGVTCDGQDPRVIAKKVKKGEYDSSIK